MIQVARTFAKTPHAANREAYEKKKAERAAARKPAEPEVIWAPNPGGQVAFLTCPVFEVLLSGNRGSGKALFHDELVLTDSGWKKVGAVTYGDRLVAPDGTYTNLLGIFPQGVKPLYRVTFSDGCHLDVDAEHLWTVQSAKTGWRDGWSVKTTEQIRGLSGYADCRTGWFIPTLTCSAPGQKWVGQDPYVLGLLLGDGTTGGQYATIYTCDQWIQDYLTQVHGWKAYDYRPRNHAVMVQAVGRKYSDTWKVAVGYNKGCDKQIAPALLDADPDSRLALLQGLMDSDGSVDKDGRCTFASISRHLADGVQYLARSLGGKATVSWKHRASSRGGGDGYWCVRIMTGNKFNPFRLPRKRDRVRTMKGIHRRIVSIEPQPDGPATCFSVDHPSQMFVCQDFIVTHNTDSLIFDFCRDVGVGWGIEWKGIIFRQDYPQLADVIHKSKKWIPRIWPQARYNHTAHFWEWPDGEMLYFRAYRHDDDYQKFHGMNLTWIGWEELCNWPSPAGYKRMISLIRSATPGIPLRLRGTTNPYGPGTSWVRRRFRLPESYGKIVRDSVDDDGKLEPPRVAIELLLHENEALMSADPGYQDRIRASARNAAELAAWTRGDWTIVSGGMIDDVFEGRYNIVQPFNIPNSWTMDRSFDWGSSHPFAVCWWAESDGTKYLGIDGKYHETVRGDLFLINEWYGWNGKENEGCRMLATDVAKGIIQRERQWGIYGRVAAGPADSQIFAEENGTGIALSMAQPVRLADGDVYPGVWWYRADKRPGSRKAGWEQMRKMFKAAHPNEGGMPREEPGLFFFNTCQQAIRTVPLLPRDQKDLDDVDTDAEDHLADAIRYRTKSMGGRAGSGTTEGGY